MTKAYSRQERAGSDFIHAPGNLLGCSVRCSGLDIVKLQIPRHSLDLLGCQQAPLDGKCLFLRWHFHTPNSLSACSEVPLCFTSRLGATGSSHKFMWKLRGLYWQVAVGRIPDCLLAQPGPTLATAAIGGVVTTWKVSLLSNSACKHRKLFFFSSEGKVQGMFVQ